MATPVKIYQQEMHDNVGFFATWLPGDRLEIGDIGVFQDGRFRKQSSLSELGIEATVSAKGSSQNLQYTSTSGTSIHMGASGAVPNAPGVSAEIKLEFSKDGAFLFNASKVRDERIENRSVLTRAILDAYDRREWKKEWYLIEAVHSADCATIIVSEDSSAGLVLSASADLSLGTIPLADPQVRLSVNSTRGRMVQVIAERNLRPLYSCLRLKDPWFSEPSVVPVRGVGRESGELLFARPSIGELLNS